jgi:hypothetical protein
MNVSKDPLDHDTIDEQRTETGVAEFLSEFNEDLDRANPKDAYGAAKVDLGYLPMAGMVYGALGMMNGGVKYGPYNWREKDVKASIYVSAAIRHLKAWAAGEECSGDAELAYPSTDLEDPTAGDSGVPHLGHAIACCMILADAIENNCLIDDRPKSDDDIYLVAAWNEKLKDLIPRWQAQRDQMDKARA